MPMSGTIQIRNLVVKKGERKQGFVEIGETPNGPVRIPLVIVNGEQDGPVLCLTAGVHATEYPPIDAVMRTIDRLEPHHVTGAVIAVPVASMAMFQSRTAFVSPIDGLDLNKIAPGARDGTISEMLAHVLLNEIIGISQYYIDLHGGDLGEILYPFVACSLTGNVDMNRRAEALARLYSRDLIVMSADAITVPPFAGFIAEAAARKGIISVFAEAGGDGTLEVEDVRTHVQGIQNVMRYLGMIEGEPSLVGTRRRGTARFLMRAKRSGLVRSRLRIGEPVAEGQQLAEICNLFGEQVEVVRSPRPGTVGLIWSRKVVAIGDPVVRCWITEPAPPFPETDRFRSTTHAS